MATFRFYNSFFAALFDEKHSIKSGGDTLKVRLLTTALDPADDVWADISADEVATGGGYTAGGLTVSVTSATWTGDSFSIIIESPSWTGSGGGFSFRSLVLVNDTAPNDELIGGVDFDRTIPIASGDNTKTLGYTQFNEITGLIVFGAQVIT